MRLLESFFRAQPFNPYVPPMEMIFSKTTAGSFSFTIPSDARNIRIEIAGGNGGKAYMWDVSGGTGGRGEKIVVLGSVVGALAGKTITGIIGATATSSTGVGGTGDPAGSNGTHSTPGGSSSYGGGGGGATKITVDSTEYQASGGGGATFNGYYGGYYHSVGGTGGGVRGGVPGASVNAESFTNGGNATGLQINETTTGYIRVYKNASSSLLFEKTTSGSFSFVIPSTASVIAIEIAAGNGATGGYGGYSSGSGDYAMSGGRGAVKVIELSGKNGQTITGTIGQSGGATGITQQGGTPDGSNGEYKSISSPPSQSYGGGGGGRSTCTLSSVTYTVSGGAGGAGKNSNVDWAQGGAGGGAGAGQPVTNSAGGNATDGDKLNTEGAGYIRIYQL